MLNHLTLPLVVTAGLIDSVNPCAVTLLLLFLAVLFMLEKSRKSIAIAGLAYITTIYLTYLLIGVGLLKANYIFHTPHLVSQIGAWLVIAIGVLSLKDYFWPESFSILKIPLGSRQLMNDWAHRASVPAAIVLGFLVGAFEFPCTGGVYFAITALLARETNFLGGFLYLLLYNLMFILPLIVIYLLATNRLVIEKMVFWQEQKTNLFKLATGLLMLALGMVILVWFV